MFLKDSILLWKRSVHNLERGFDGFSAEVEHLVDRLVVSALFTSRLRCFTSCFLNSILDVETVAVDSLDFSVTVRDGHVWLHKVCYVLFVPENIVARERNEFESAFGYEFSLPIHLILDKYNK